MVKKSRSHLEGRSKADRQAQRRRLGPLRTLTVQSKTRARYDKAMERYRNFLREESRPYPRDAAGQDYVLSHYIEHLWETGEGRALACDSVAAVQDFHPFLRGHLPSAWRLLKTWSANELPNRAPPLPLEALHVLAGYALFSDQPLFALSLLLGFHGLLRTGELLGVQKAHVVQSGPRSPAVISLGFTKGGKRAGAAESVTIREEDTLRRLWQWLSSPHTPTTLCGTPHAWRKTFNECLLACQLDSYDFRPYSLRRGGATMYFGRHGSLDRLLVQGRWASSKTARIYINEGLAVLAELKLTFNGTAQAYRRQFQKSLRVPLQTLELHPKGGPGGRGRKQRPKRKTRK